QTLPLTPPEWPEWGDPSRDAAAFRTILAYSPYENVRAQSYPAILALAGLTDPRVLWMRQHAFGALVGTSSPWGLEAELLSSSLRLPLNVDGNPWIEAVALVRAVRLKARQLADELDIIADSGGPRKRPPQISTPPSLG